MKDKIKVFLIALLVVIVFALGPIEKLEASRAIRLIINNQDVTSQAMPIIENGRTLVPLRFISEDLGAKVTWESADRSALIEKDGESVLLKIESRLISYNDGQDYELSDVAPKLLKKDEKGYAMTYVPLRLIGNALDIGVEWNDQERTIYIDSDKATNKESISAIKIVSQVNNEKISGKTSIQINTEKEYKAGAYVQFLLLEKGETSGFIIEEGNDINGKYTFTPKIEDNGQKTLAAIVYDKDGVYLDGDAIAIDIQVNPKVYLSGVKEGDIIEEATRLSTDANFFPLYVKYEIRKINESGEDKLSLTDLKDPLGTYRWDPSMRDNGLYSIRAIAYDRSHKPYYSEPIEVTTNKARVLTLSGVKEGMLLDKEVNLIANRNFDVSETEYLIKDVNTGIVSTLASMPYGGYRWNPSPDDSGLKELSVRVLARGRTYESDPVRVQVNGQAKLILEGVRPGQVINKEITLSAKSNVDVENIKYFITDPTSNKKWELKEKADNDQVIYKPLESHKDAMIVEAQGDYQGKTISSEKIEFKIYHGDFFESRAIVEKDQFIPLVSKTAVESYKKSKMSAALISAQAILETGWGQKVPVNKYTGVLSNNLFGIKGRDPVGSVVSNTWEVYSGKTYRMDAYFRAYNKIEESYQDHQKFLLNGERYKPFTEVMFDYTKGAWALQRSGYATDPEYALKLINIIRSNKLYELDKIDL